jgi:hypothetical protein
MIESSQVIAEMIAIAKDMQSALKRDEDLGLNPDEIVKHTLGKLKLPVPYEELFPKRLQALGFGVLLIKHRTCTSWCCCRCTIAIRSTACSSPRPAWKDSPR